MGEYEMKLSKVANDHVSEIEVQIENSGSQFVFPVYFPIELIIFARWNRI
jgi:hypothetical protein